MSLDTMSCLTQVYKITINNRNYNDIYNFVGKIENS